MSAFPAVDSCPLEDSDRVVGKVLGRFLGWRNDQGLHDLVHGPVQLNHPESTSSVAVGLEGDHDYGKQSCCWVDRTRLDNPVFVLEPYYRCCSMVGCWMNESGCRVDRECFREGVGSFVVGDLRLVPEVGKVFVRVDY